MRDTKFSCPQCNQHLEGDSALIAQEIQCPVCEKSFKITVSTATNGRESKLKIEDENAYEVHKIAAKLSGHLTTFAGVEKLEGFNLKDLFSEVFRKHSKDEIEDYFIVGTKKTTPPLNQVDTGWPKPWMFFRTFLSALVIYMLFLWAWDHFKNSNLIPGLIMVGSFAVPISTLLFFFEINAPRNFSLYQVIRLLFLGGILSLIFSLFLFQLTDYFGLGLLGASLAGLVEEPGKLFALLTVAGIAKYRYKLNGLLFGAAVGTGFAAFESAGYAFRFLLRHGDDAMSNVILVRGMLSPFGHIAWTAMVGGALWRVKGDKKFSFKMLTDLGFLRVLAVAAVLHMLWNSPIELPFYGKYVILGVAAWIVVLGIAQEGLKEIRAAKSADKNAESL